MNRYYAVLFEPVKRHGGLVQDVVGDSMLAIWATTEPDASLRNRACLAALDIAAAVDRFNADSGRLALPTRIGLHSGRLLLGSVGAMDHYEYRAVGDIVNTATRLEGLNKHLGTRMLVSADVLEGLRRSAEPRAWGVPAGGQVPAGRRSRADRAGRHATPSGPAACVLSLRRLSPPTGVGPGPRPCGSGTRRSARTEETMGRAASTSDGVRRTPAEPPTDGWDGVVRMDQK